MTFWEHFLRLLPYKPKQAFAALYWHLTRRRVRARNRLSAESADLPFAYDLWIQRVERAGILAQDVGFTMKAWSWRPSFSVLLYTDGRHSPAQLQRSIRSVERQTYASWRLVSEMPSSIGAALRCIDGDYVVPLRVGDALAEFALFRFAELLQEKHASILYGDSDQLDRRGRRVRPWFKPRWNAEMFLAQDFISSAVAVNVGLARKIAPSAIRHLDIHTFLLEATSAANESIVHVPHIVCHVGSGDPDISGTARIESVTRHLKPLGGQCVPGPFGTVKVCWPLPDETPKASIIIPTRDKVDLLRACVGSVLNETTYEPFEIIIVDNGSIERASLAYLAEIAEHPVVRVLRYDWPYNYSSINNFATKAAEGAFLCFLNNDTEVIEPEWLTEMMRYAIRPEIGAVGAKLLYPDQTIQHAGVVIGLGEAAGHAHRFAEADQPGYFRQPHVAQFASAVTAACLVVAKSKFEAVGGFDEEHLPIAFNDVDLCLKLQAAGWRNAYVPHAVLLHYESKSRGDDLSAQHRARYLRELSVLQNRWGTKNYADPLHNPNLDRASETYVIRV